MTSHQTLLDWLEGWIMINGLLLLTVIMLTVLIVQFENQRQKYERWQRERRIKRARKEAMLRAELYQLPGRGMRHRPDVIAIGDRRRHVVRSYPGGRAS
jgi:hypothetical protein